MPCIVVSVALARINPGSRTGVRRQSPLILPNPDATFSTCGMMCIPAWEESGSQVPPGVRGKYKLVTPFLYHTSSAVKIPAENFSPTPADMPARSPRIAFPAFAGAGGRNPRVTAARRERGIPAEGNLGPKKWDSFPQEVGGESEISLGSNPRMAATARRSSSDGGSSSLMSDSDASPLQSGSGLSGSPK